MMTITITMISSIIMCLSIILLFSSGLFEIYTHISTRWRCFLLAALLILANYIGNQYRQTQLLEEQIELLNIIAEPILKQKAQMEKARIRYSSIPSNEKFILMDGEK